MRKGHQLQDRMAGTAVGPGPEPAALLWPSLPPLWALASWLAIMRAKTILTVSDLLLQHPQPWGIVGMRGGLFKEAAALSSPQCLYMGRSSWQVLILHTAVCINSILLAQPWAIYSLCCSFCLMVWSLSSFLHWGHLVVWSLSSFLHQNTGKKI